MSRILLIGYLPPSLMGSAKIEAANYRTWQFLEGLLCDRHTIYLCAKCEPSAPAQLILPTEWQESLSVETIAFDKLDWRRKLQQAHDRFHPDCIVAVNFDICHYVTRLSTGCPIWMDIYGDMLTIVQAAFYRAGSNRGLPTSIAFAREIFKKGDKFSTCGAPQQHMQVGELAMAGRLNYRTFGYRFAEVVRPGANPIRRPARKADKPNFARLGIRPEDFVVLWCGGYNTWTDIDTLFLSLEMAMDANQRIHYLSVGANTYQAPDNVYDRLLGKIAQSRYRDRFHMLGWRPWSEIDGIYAESDVGLNIDALHYETIYGTRTRILEMMAAGLPVITSLGSELSYLITEKNASLSFEIGDWQSLGGCMLRLANDTELCQRISQIGLAYIQNELSFSSTTAPVREWAVSPSRAPDHLTARGENISETIHFIRSLVRRGIWRIAGFDK